MKGASPIPTKAGLQYGPTASGKLDISVYHHRNTANGKKTLWDSAFKPSEEYLLFELGDGSGWFCSEGNLWGILDDGRRRLGTGGERLSFCPLNPNATLPWHGYPVSTASHDYEVPEDVMEKWEIFEVISKITARRIRGGKL